MSSNQSPRELLLANLSRVREIIGFLARRHRLSAEQVEELDSLVRLHLVEDDYAVLRRWRQQSTLDTYLNIVVQRVFHDYCNRMWGRWRASAAALRLGPLAQALEELLYRDRLTYEEACTVLLLQGRGDRATLDELHGQLPPRAGKPRLEPIAAAQGHPSALPDPEEAAVRLTEQAEVVSAVRDGLRRLRAQDRLLLRLRFGQELSVPEIARVLGTPQKPLFKRLAVLLRTLRRELRRSGLDRNAILRVLQHQPSLELGLRADEGEGPEHAALDESPSDQRSRKR